MTFGIRNVRIGRCSQEGFRLIEKRRTKPVAVGHRAGRADAPHPSTRGYRAAAADVLLRHAARCSQSGRSGTGCRRPACRATTAAEGLRSLVVCPSGRLGLGRGRRCVTNSAVSQTGTKMPSRDTMSRDDLFGDLRQGARNVAGVTWQVAVSVHLLILARAGELPFASVTPEGFEDLDCTAVDGAQTFVQMEETAAGEGRLTAVDVAEALKHAEDGARGAQIVLITDGEPVLRRRRRVARSHHRTPGRPPSWRGCRNSQRHPARAVRLAGWAFGVGQVGAALALSPRRCPRGPGHSGPQAQDAIGRRRARPPRPAAPSISDHAGRRCRGRPWTTSHERLARSGGCPT